MACWRGDTSLDGMEEIKDNKMNSCHENRNVGEGIIQGTEVGEMVDNCGTDWKDAEKQYSYTDLYCVYSDGSIRHVNEDDELISDVELYCVIETDETKPSQADTCIEKYYEFADGEILSICEEDWEDYNKSFYCVIEMEKANLNISESESLSRDFDQNGFDRCLQSEQQTNNTEPSESESDFVLTDTENDSTCDDGINDHGNTFRDSLSCDGETDRMKVSNATGAQISESDLACFENYQINMDKPSNNAESSVFKFERRGKDNQPDRETAKQNGECLDYPCKIIVPHTSMISQINLGSQHESDKPVLRIYFPPAGQGQRQRALC